jgi:hypothetical protein
LDQKELVKATLIEYGFGATIEVTNGMGDSCGSKAKQALRAKEFLRRLSEKGADVVTGLAYIASRSVVEHTHGINVLLSIAKYDPWRLRQIFEEIVQLNVLDTEESKLVELMLKRTDQEWDLPGFICGPQLDLHKRAKYLGFSFGDYARALGNIKGFTMELYIGSLMRDEIQHGYIFHRLGFSYKGENEDRSKRRSDADVVVVCQESHFYHAVESLNRRPNIEARVLSRRVS